MAVRKKDNTGTLLVYVPLTLLREQQGDQPVAFTGRIYYEPNSTDFGPAQKMRLVWAIRAKVDVCNAPAGTDYDTHCKNNSNLVTQEEVIHTYVDEWYLTGLTAREEHGIDVGVIFENESYASGSSHYENYLWHLADGLQSAPKSSRLHEQQTARGQEELLYWAFQQASNRTS
jgi:hypothetical protein